MKDEIIYYGLTFEELLALAVLYQAVKIFRSAILGDNQNEASSSDSK